MIVNIILIVANVEENRGIRGTIITIFKSKIS